MNMNQTLLARAPRVISSYKVSVSRAGVMRRRLTQREHKNEYDCCSRKRGYSNKNNKNKNRRTSNSITASLSSMEMMISSSPSGEPITQKMLHRSRTNTFTATTPTIPNIISVMPSRNRQRHRLIRSYSSSSSTSEGWSESQQKSSLTTMELVKKHFFIASEWLQTLFPVWSLLAAVAAMYK